MRIVCISDTHLRPLENVPDGDVLVHAGDLTMMGTLDEIRRANQQLSELPHKHKVVIAGNHDWGFQESPDQARSVLTAAHYLQDEAIEIGTTVFYGAPWQPWFYDWAFNLQRGDEIKQKWDLIPTDVDVLVTHGPPFGIGDRTSRGEMVGCRDLHKRIIEISPKLHVFGHVHEGYGRREKDGTIFINASVCDEKYRPINAPIVVDL